MQKIFLLLLLCSITRLLPAQTKKTVLNHIAVYVKDLKTSAHFYSNVIQLDTIPEPFHDGKHAWFSTGSNSHLHLIQGADTVTAHPKNNHICFSVASVNDFITVLKKKKLNLKTGREKNMQLPRGWMVFIKFILKTRMVIGLKLMTPLNKPYKKIYGITRFLNLMLTLPDAEPR